MGREEGFRPLGVEDTRGLFVPEIVCGAKSFRAFPFARSLRALPQSSAVLHRLMGVLGNELGNFRQNHPEVVQDCVRASKKGELDFHPLRSNYFREGTSSSVIDCPATDLTELKARSRSPLDVYVWIRY